MYFDPTYVLVLIGAVISMIASANVRFTFNRYSKKYSRSGMTAEQVALMIMQMAGIHDVTIGTISGNLTDHYSPNEKVLRLSDSVFGSTSVAAIGVAAHECGHAIQHHDNYALLGLRSAAVPIANIGSKLSWPVILLGVILELTGLIQAGIILFLFVVVFQLITLPVEINASRRALAVLKQGNILVGDELSGAGKVLTSAAFTYVAALFTSILQLLRLIMIAQRGNRRR